MNLVYDAWIPVRRKNGAKEGIAPWQLTDKYIQDPVIEIAAIRPDFNGALIQFLIGLLQTTCAPQGNSDWRAWMKNPPTPKDLKVKFETVAFAFNLEGNGPRFMQDLTVEQEKTKTTEIIDKLLIDAPGEQTLKQNKDLFIKRDRVKKLCFTCCAQALLTLQINAPTGGKGHRVGLRGGGPVNTIVLGDSLWSTAWMNVLDETEFGNMAASAKIEAADKFPWLAETRTSEKDRATTSQDVHPAQIYWAMPRRVRLIITNETGNCDLCHDREQLVKEYFTKPYGVKYTSFVHPLTPTYRNKDGEVLSVHQHEALGYKHWLGYVQNTDEGREPARIIVAVQNRGVFDFRLWAFGYDMDNMKACCWYEGTMPGMLFEGETMRSMYGAIIAQLIHASNVVAELLSKAIVKALNAGMFNAVRQRFWQETEAEFYKQVKVLHDDVLKNGDGLTARQAWHLYLAKKTEQIFDDMAQTDMIDAVNPKRVAAAWNELRKNIYGKKLKQEILGLPKE